MSEIIDTAKSTSFIATLGFNRNLTYTIQSTNLGGASLNPARMPARFSDIPFPGDKVEFGDLAIRFLVDEDLSQWVDLNEWMFIASEGITEENVDDIINNIEITILNRQNQPTVRIVYHNTHVINIGDIEYDMVGEEQTLVCNASFVYTHYTITKVSTGETIDYGKPKRRLN